MQREYPPPQFRDPFRDGPRIVEKLIRKFHVVSVQSVLVSAERAVSLKDGRLLKTLPVRNFYHDELSRLADGVNYWLYLLRMPMGSSSRIYDCQAEALKQLLYMSSGLDRPEFYIAEKKFSWAIYVDVRREKDTVAIYKSGDEKTPFG